MLHASIAIKRNNEDTLFPFCPPLPLPPLKSSTDLCSDYEVERISTD